MSDSVRPHRRQPTRLPHPWDSPGKNTAVGCHCLLQCMKVKSESEVVQSCPTLSDPIGLQPTRFLHPWDFPGKNTGVGCHCLLWMECYSAIKRNKILPFRNMDGFGDYHNKWGKSDREIQILYDITYPWNLKNNTNESVYKTETDSQT